MKVYWFLTVGEDGIKERLIQSLLWEKIGTIQTKKIKERKHEAVFKTDKGIQVQIHSNL